MGGGRACYLVLFPRLQRENNIENRSKGALPRALGGRDV